MVGRIWIGADQVGIRHRTHREGAARPDALGEPALFGHWSGGSGTDDGFGTNVPGDGSYPQVEASTANPPLAYLAVSAVSVLTAVALLVSAAHKPLANLISWFLAGPVAIVCVGLFLGADTKRRSATVYFGKPWSKTAYTVIALTAVVIAAWAAWEFADWAARR